MSSSQADSTPTEETRLPLNVLVTYSLPTVGIGFMFFMVALYLMKFGTDNLMISPAVMGAIFGISRIWDALTDPVAGYLSDRTEFSFGRRRPWILLSILPIGITFYMLWSPPQSFEGTALIVWMGASVLLFYTAMTIFVVPHTSLGAELSVDYHERTTIFGLRHVIWNSGSLLALVAMYLLITAEDIRSTAADMSLIAGGLTAVLMLWMVFRTEERAEYQGRGERNPLTAFADVVRNPHARLLLIVFFIENLGAATIGIMTPYVSQYVVGTPNLTPFYIALYLIPSIASVPVWVYLSRRVGKKRLWILSMLLTGGGFGAMFFLTEGAITLICILAVICGLGAGSGAVVGPSIQADVIDYDEYRSGKRKEGAYFATWNFVFKTATGITLMLTGFVLEYSGFIPNVAQTDDVKFALLALYALFPLVCYAVGALIFTRFSLDEAEYDRIRAKLGSH
jgi:sugar (glycoside-pentoside-hexuronide) transporter|tara:strand:- start:4936 stop:6294 length:1359 start_codon:yes stop_codon:yes gene_type:complete